MSKKYTRRALFSAIFLFCGLMVGQAKSLVLTLTDGSLVYYYLGGETKPVMRFNSESEGFSVGADNYLFSGVTNFYISATDNPNGIASVEMDKVSIHSGMISLRGDHASVYSIDGKKMDAKIESVGEMQTVDISGLPKGVYVIKSGKTSLKVRK